MKVHDDAGKKMAGTPEGNLVEAARAGDNQAFGKLFDTWFDRVHDVSRRIVRDPGTAGEVAQDTFLAAWTGLANLEDPDAFGGWVLRIARNKSLNRLEKDRRSVALDDETMTTLTDMDAADHDPLAHLDQAGRVALVWDAAAALGERDMSILDLHLRHGLGAGELAEELGTTANNAHQMLFTLRKRLGTNVRALVLWRAGRPACENLRRTLANAGIHTFDKQAVKAIDRHAQVCDQCSQEREDRLNPAALFGAAPVLAAPFVFKTQAASALEAAGVPMGGSTALGTPAGIGTATPASPVTSPVASPVAVPSDPSDSDPTPDADDRSTAKRVRVVAVAAVALMLVGGAVWLSGSLSARGNSTHLAAISTDTTEPADDGPVTSSSTDSTSATSETSGVPTTAEGGFVIDGSDTVPGGGTSPPQTTPEGRPTPPPPTQPGTTVTDPPATTVTTPPRPTSPSTTQTTTDTVPPAAPPVILDFTATATDQCRGGVLYELVWDTTQTTQVYYGLEGAPAAIGKSVGKASICHLSTGGNYTPPRFVLVAEGPGGKVQQIVTGGYRIP